MQSNGYWELEEGVKEELRFDSYCVFVSVMEKLWRQIMMVANNVKVFSATESNIQKPL
jgi:hypothetical protein